MEHKFVPQAEKKWSPKDGLDWTSSSPLPFPTEVLSHLVPHLDLRTFLGVSCVSKRLCALFDETIPLQSAYDSWLERMQGWSFSGKIPKERDVALLCAKVKEVLANEPTVLELPAPLYIVGDIHGQFADFVEEILPIIGRPPDSNILLLGNYVNRGYNSLEVFLLRGNHESRQITQCYGFYDQVMNLYGNNTVWKLICDVFDSMPVAAVLSEMVFAVHSGLSPHLDTMDHFGQVHRHDEVPIDGPYFDLLWNEPDDRAGWGTNRTGYTWGEDITRQWNHVNGFDLMVRAHSLMMAGYQYTHNDQICTIFSAPNYCYRCENKGAVLFLGEFLEQVISVYDSAPKVPTVKSFRV